MNADSRPLAPHPPRDEVVAWLAGVTEFGRDEEIRQHVAACPDCRRTVEAIRPSDAPDAMEDHLPPTLLARWDRDAPALRGELRELVRRHLERCASCRAELETLGKRPEIVAAAIVPIAPPGSTRRAWIYGASAAALAAAASIAIFINNPPNLQPSPGSRPHVEPPSQPAPPAVSEPRPVPKAQPARLDLVPRPAHAQALPATHRGGAPDARVPVFSFELETGTLALDPPRALAVFDDGPLLISLADGDGGHHLALRTTVAALFPTGTRRAIVLERGEPPLPAGRYTLRFQRMGESDAPLEESAYVFEIR